MLALAGIALFTLACQDTTAPIVSPDGTTPRLGQASPYYCSTRSAAPGGVREARIPLSFPPEARSGDGSAMEYRYRRQTPSGVVTYTADCMIPRTMSALEQMNRRFHVPPEQGSPKGRDEEGGEFTTRGCVTDSTSGCTLEPITVVGTSPLPEPEEPDPIYPDPREPDPLPGWGGGGGSGEPTYDRSGEWNGVGELLECPKASGYGTSGYTEEHCEKIESAIEYLKTHPNTQCRTFGENAYRYFHEGRSYFYWSWGGAGIYGGYSGGSVGLTPLAFNSGELSNTIAHEEAHRLNWPDRYVNGAKQQPAPDGRYADDWGAICDGPV